MHQRYQGAWSKSKTLTFVKAFILYFTHTRLDIRYQAFRIFVELPKVVKERKNVTNRIVTKEDIQSIVDYIRRADSCGVIGRARAERYTAFTIFGALTGQRSMATMIRPLASCARLYGPLNRCFMVRVSGGQIACHAANQSAKLL